MNQQLAAGVGYLQGMVIQLCSEGINIGGKHLLKEWQQSVARSQAEEEALYSVLEATDELLLDFSDWEPKDLNLHTTSRVFGIPAGYVRYSCGILPRKAPCSTSAADGQFVVKLYRWCRAKAPNAPDSQRSFKFKKGKYVGDGSLSSMTWAGVGAVAGLLVAAFAA